jgi:hypothetical protein
MDTSKIKEVKLLLKKLQSGAVRDFEVKFGRIRFQGGGGIMTTAAVYKAVLAAEENCRELISEAVEATLAQSNAPYAYALIDDVLLAHMSDLEGLIHGGSGSPLSHSMIEVAEKRFVRVRNASVRRLKSQKQRFKIVPNPEGRPPEFDWGEMNAFVLEQYPEGLPTIHGTKSKIVEFYKMWLDRKGLSYPSTRQMERMAARIYDKNQNVIK